MRTRVSLLIATALSLAVISATPFALAQQAPQSPTQAAPREVRGEVLVILGSERPGEIDPALSSLGALRQAPFSSFQTMQLLARPSIRLVMNEPQDIPLPNGRILRIVLAAVTPEGRFRVRVSINRPEQSDYLPLLEVVAPAGDPFFLAGQNFLGGTLVLGVRLGERPTTGR
jgi:hypothetical protein